MTTMASQITSITVVYLTVYSDVDQRKHQSSVSLCGEFTGTGEFPTQRASYAENVSIWWRHHDVDLEKVASKHRGLVTHWYINTVGHLCVRQWLGAFGCDFTACIDDDLLSIRHVCAKFSDIRIKTQKYPLKKMHLEIPSVRCRPYSSDLPVLNLAGNYSTQIYGSSAVVHIYWGLKVTDFNPKYAPIFWVMKFWPTLKNLLHSITQIQDIKKSSIP